MVENRQFEPIPPLFGTPVPLAMTPLEMRRNLASEN